MAEFIEVTEIGNRRLINLAWVEEIRDVNGHAQIYFAFNAPYATEQDYMNVDQSYDDVCRRIWRTDND